jgi:ribosomal protein S18 acetylase RimI-like enzyme
VGEAAQPITYRAATAADSAAVAHLHADSWRRHYRGAYADEFLDGPVWEDRLTIWTERLAEPTETTSTIVAEFEGQVVGLVHTVFDDDPRWGALLDNLHVSFALKGGGIGTQLMSRSAAALRQHSEEQPLYLWVLAQNTAGQAFYDARGGTCVERRSRHPQPGDALRYTWLDPSRLIVHH